MAEDGTMDDLKPCPFCGTKLYVKDNFYNHDVRACPLSNYGFHISSPAVKWWQNRTTPPGYALVPIEPTIEMIGAMEKEFNGEFHPDFYPVSIWKAAIQALTEGE